MYAKVTGISACGVLGAIQGMSIVNFNAQQSCKNKQVESYLNRYSVDNCFKFFEQRR